MPFQELAPRTSGQILGASYLNALSENVEWVFGAAQAVNMPFQGWRADDDDITATEAAWYVRHRLRYLHYSVDVNDPLDGIHLKASLPDGTGTVTLWEDNSPDAGDQNFQTYTDTDGDLTVGTWYKVWWELGFVGGNNGIWINYMAECDATAFDTETNAGYGVPPTWARGDTVSHTEMNAYKTALDAARTQTGDVQWNVLVMRNNTQDRGYFLLHRQRYLHHIGNGELLDPSGAGDAVALTGDGANVVAYDLLNVSWLAEGMLYEVKDVTFCCEDYDP